MSFDADTQDAIKEAVAESLEEFFKDNKTDDLKGKTGGCDLWVRNLPNGKVRIDVEVMDQTSAWKAKEAKPKEAVAPAAAGGGPPGPKPGGKP